MEILENISLKPFNTFGIDAIARYFTRFDNIIVLQEALQWAKKENLPTLIMGGGSNILFTKNFDGLVLQNAISGIENVKEDDDHIYIKAGAGEVWHSFVLYCLNNNYAGIENLALIPGCVGASPMQNIGAYGMEIKEVFHELQATHRQDIVNTTFNNNDCHFGYRESVFKNIFKNQFVITHVTYKLHKKPIYHIEYGAIRQQLEKEGIINLSIQAVARAVIAIRSSKLPDPTVIGNAGSFFKNPSVARPVFEELHKKFPQMVAYENPDGSMKLAAGWLIEKAGLKGYKKNDAGVHENQALVLVNYGAATGKEILDVCDHVKEKVREIFGIELHAEVNII